MASRTCPERSASASYVVRIHDSVHLRLLPNPRSCEVGCFTASPELARSLDEALMTRRPWDIGRTSERVVVELMTGGTLLTAGGSWTLACERVASFASRTGLQWKPRYGVRCDDLVTFDAHTSTPSILFVTECKGTTQDRGISPTREAMMFYQLSRTLRQLKWRDPHASPFRSVGVISAIVNHAWRVITINVIDQQSSFAGELPDSWMYPGRGSAGI